MPVTRTVAEDALEIQITNMMEESIPIDKGMQSEFVPDHDDQFQRSRVFKLGLVFMALLGLVYIVNNFDSDDVWGLVTGMIVGILARLGTAVLGHRAAAVLNWLLTTLVLILLIVTLVFLPPTLQERVYIGFSALLFCYVASEFIFDMVERRRRE